MKTTMRNGLILFLKLSAFFLFDWAATIAQAAEIKIEGTTISLSGDIVSGDANSLLDAIENAEAAGVTNLKLSLNSGGGNFQEGLKMSKRLGGHSVGTIVKAGNVCQSACALVFLGGSLNSGEAESDADRTLEVGAQLGFHAPYVDSVQGKSKVTVEIGDLTQRMTEELKSLNKHLVSIGVPESIMQSLLVNDAQHTLYDATSMEAIELLKIRLPEFDSGIGSVTREMVINGCINGFRLGRQELPGKTAALDRKLFEVINKKYKITMPEGKEGGFALVPAARLNSGDVAVCKMTVDGVCQGFYELDSIFHYSKEASQIPELQGCQRENNGTALVPPGTLLQDLKATLEKMQQAGDILLAPGDTIPPDGEDGADFQAGKTYETPTDAVICNHLENTKFANVREGPNLNYKLVVQLPNNTPVKIEGEVPNPVRKHMWNKISFAGGTGFVDKDFVSPDCLIALALPPVIVAPIITVAPPPQVRQGVICNRKPGGDSANIRSSPNPLASDILGKAFNNELLTIIGSANNPVSGQLYFKVTVQGVTGYVDNELVSTSCNAVAPAVVVAPVVQDQSTAYICNSKFHITNMRSGPNADNFGVLLTLANRDEVTVLGHTTNPVSGRPWLRVHARGLEGFVDASSVAATCNLSQAAFTPPPALTRVMCNPDSDFTNMRLGPNKEMFNVVSKLNNGETIRILETTTNPVSTQKWFKIEARGDVGFVDSDYVSDGCQ